MNEQAYRETTILKIYCIIITLKRYNSRRVKFYQLLSYLAKIYPPGNMVPAFVFILSLMIYKYQSYLLTEEPCDWDLYFCDYYNPYPMEYTYMFKCNHHLNCPKNFKCCKHHCFRHKICQPYRNRPAEVLTPKFHHPDNQEKPGVCDIRISCDVVFSLDLTRHFECSNDYACPLGYKCCHIDCWGHKVCQPVKQIDENQTVTVATTLDEDGITMTVPVEDTRNITYELLPEKHYPYSTESNSMQENISTIDPFEETQIVTTEIIDTTFAQTTPDFTSISNTTLDYNDFSYQYPISTETTLNMSEQLYTNVETPQTIITDIIQNTSLHPPTIFLINTSDISSRYFSVSTITELENITDSTTVAYTTVPLQVIALSKEPNYYSGKHNTTTDEDSSIYRSTFIDTSMSKSTSLYTITSTTMANGMSTNISIPTSTSQANVTTVANIINSTTIPYNASDEYTSINKSTSVYTITSTPTNETLTNTSIPTSTYLTNMTTVAIISNFTTIPYNAFDENTSMNKSSSVYAITSTTMTNETLTNTSIPTSTYQTNMTTEANIINYATISYNSSIIEEDFIKTTIPNITFMSTSATKYEAHSTDDHILTTVTDEISQALQNVLSSLQEEHTKQTITLNTTHTTLLPDNTSTTERLIIIDDEDTDLEGIGDGDYEQITDISIRPIEKTITGGSITTDDEDFYIDQSGDGENIEGPNGDRMDVVAEQLKNIVAAPIPNREELIHNADRSYRRSSYYEQIIPNNNIEFIDNANKEYRTTVDTKHRSNWDQLYKNYIKSKYYRYVVTNKKNNNA